MHIEIVSIGDELLKGMTINTNAAFIGRALFEQGYEVSRQTVFSDEPIILDKELRAALSRSSIIIATGGLGSTLDDHTRRIAAVLFDSEFAFNEKVAADLKHRFGDRPISLKDQATLPVKAQPLMNTVGTAPGLVFEKDNKMLILLPGVPQEMQVMFTEKVLPLLREHFPAKQKTVHVKLQLCLTTESVIDPTLRELKERFADVHIGIYPAVGLVSVFLHSANGAQLQSCKEAFISKFAHNIYSTNSETLEEMLQKWFSQHKKTLALAESCTGGKIASQLVSVPGSSDYFLGSLVTYADILKNKLLNVSEKTLKAHGAVSRESVAEMLSGVFQITGADFAIAVSGIAGPTGGSAEKPVGTVWAAIGEKGKKPDIGHFSVTGPRSKVIQVTTNYLLGALWRKAAHGIPAFPLF